MRITAEMPAHTHQEGANTATNNTSGTPGASYVAQAGGNANVFAGAGAFVATSSADGGAAHNNLQPYVVVGNIWQRTA